MWVKGRQSAVGHWVSEGVGLRDISAIPPACSVTSRTVFWEDISIVQCRSSSSAMTFQVQRARGLSGSCAHGKSRSCFPVRVPIMLSVLLRIQKHSGWVGGCKNREGWWILVSFTMAKSITQEKKCVGHRVSTIAQWKPGGRQCIEVVRTMDILSGHAKWVTLASLFSSSQKENGGTVRNYIWRVGRKKTQIVTWTS